MPGPQADLNNFNTLPHKHFRLQTLGGLTLFLPDGAEDRELATRRRKLAVLAYLAILDKPVARATLIELFWGDQPEERARHSLSDTLSSLRRVLGSAALSARLADVQLDSAGAGLSIDAIELTRAAADGKHAEVIALYGGPFLPAFAVPGSQSFDAWIEEERLRLSKLFARSCRALCLEYERQEDWAASLALGLRWLEADPLSTGAQLAVLKGHADDGSPDALKTALQKFGQLEQRLSRDFGALPDRDVRILVESWRSRLNDAGVSAIDTSPTTLAVPTAPVAPSDIPPAAPPAAPAVSAAPRPRRRTFVMGGIAAATIVAAAALVAWSRRTPAAPAEPRWVVVADVENKTGDSVFDRTVSVALAAALAQSPHVRVVAPDRVGRTLYRMRRPDNDPTLNEALAREVAQRDGVPVVIVPSVNGAGRAYELTTRVLDAATGSVLGFAAVRADDRADVLPALDRLGREVRSKLGETARSIRANSAPLPLGTTTSLEALKKYAEGLRAFRIARYDATRSLWTEAAAIDTGFALAYAGLGMLGYFTNQSALGDSMYARAFAHLGTLTEREQVVIRAAAMGWRGDNAGSAKLLEEYLAAHPQDFGIMRTLAYQYLRTRRSAEGATMFQRVLAIDSLDHGSWINLATIEHQRENLEAALRAYGRARRIAPMILTVNNNVNLEYAGTFVDAGLLDSAAIVIAELAASPDALRRARAFRSQAFLDAYMGRYEAASANLANAIALSRQENQGTSEIRSRLLLAMLLEERGRSHDAAVQVDSSYVVVQRTSTEPTIFYWVGKALARRGDTRRASVLLAHAERLSRSDSPTALAALEGLRGEVQLARRDPKTAVVHLQRALAIDSGAVTLESTAHGLAMAGRLAEAAGLYERLESDFRFGSEAQLLGRLAPYWLGRVREREGKPELARAAYERYLSAWKNPDAKLLSVLDARARLEPLRRRD